MIRSGLSPEVFDESRRADVGFHGITQAAVGETQPSFADTIDKRVKAKGKEQRWRS